MPLPLPQSNPILTDAHYQLLNQTLESCARTRDLLDKLERAGIPLPDLRQQCELNHGVAAGLKREFFPHKQ